LAEQIATLETAPSQQTPTRSHVPKKKKNLFSSTHSYSNHFQQNLSIDHHTLVQNGPRQISHKIKLFSSSIVRTNVSDSESIIEKTQDSLASMHRLKRTCSEKTQNKKTKNKTNTKHAIFPSNFCGGSGGALFCRNAALRRSGWLTRRRRRRSSSKR
jgi:predicted outer membrane repeat protein